MNKNSFDIVSSNLKKYCQGEVKRTHSLKKLTTIGASGKASIYLLAEDVDDIRIAVEQTNNNKIPYFVIGKGSNIVISDEGFKGLVVQLGYQFHEIKVEGNTIVCGAGINLSKVVKKAYKYSLTGLEFAVGIPATVGGAIAVNAGAYHNSVCEKTNHVNTFSKSGMKSYDAVDIKRSSYRKSFLPKSEVILEAVFVLEKGKRENIKKRMDKYLKDRSEKQPLDYPNSGSIFKNPSNISAGELVENAGWKGKKIGEAQVSEKHANFIINIGNAKVNDIYSLIKLIQSDIYHKFGVKLEPEVKLIGFNNEQEAKKNIPKQKE